MKLLAADWPLTITNPLTTSQELKKAETLPRVDNSSTSLSRLWTALEGRDGLDSA